MGTVATGSVLLTPKFDHLEATLTKQLNGAWSGVNGAATKAGAGASKAFGGGLMKQGGIIGAASAITSRAFDAISASIGSAVERVDTMANFPKVMKNLGYSSNEAKDSIKRMSKAIDGMPTTLSGITGMTQQLAPLCGGLDEATSISIAMNNALLAGGAGAADVSRAMQQYSQMLSKGKPELQDWKTLQEVMPGQLNQIAQALLGPTANSQDLYQALKDGRLSMDDFNGAMVRLNDEGVNGFASFAQQAKDATQGIGTAMENVKNRIAKALQKVIESIGQTNISGAINAVSESFDGMADVAVNAVNFIKDNFSTIAPVVMGAAGAFVAFKAAAGLSDLVKTLSAPIGAIRIFIAEFGMVSSLCGPLTAVKTSVSMLGQGITSLCGGPVGLAIAAIAAVVGAVVYAYNTNEEARAAIDNVWNGLQQLASAVWPAIQGVITGVMDTVGAVIGAVWPVIENTITTVMNAIDNVIHIVLAAINGDWSGVWNGIKALLSIVWNGIGSIVSGGINAAKGVIGSVLGTIKGIWDGAWNSLKSFVGQIWDGIKSGVNNGIQGVMDYIGQLPGKITGFFSGAGSWLWNAGKSILDGLLGGLKSAWSSVTNFVGGIGDWIVEHKGPPAYDKVMLVRNGQLIMGGLLRGMTDGFKPVQAFVEDGTAAIAHAFKVDAGAASWSAAGGTQAAVNQTINFNQPVKSPDEVARAMRMQARYGIAATV